MSEKPHFSELRGIFKDAYDEQKVCGWCGRPVPDPRAKNLAEILDLCVETLNAAGLELKDTNPKAAEVIGKVLRIARADLSEWEGGK